MEQSEFRGYVQSPHHRFEVSLDPISQKRYEYVKTIGKELDTFPFYRGLTLKGSLSKGKVLTAQNARQTDINMGCFLDFGAIASLPDEDLDSLCKKYQIDGTPDFTAVTVNESKWNIFPSYGLDPKMLAKIRLARNLVFQFSRQRADSFFRSFFKESPAKPADNKIWPEVGIYSSVDGPFSIFSALEEYEGSKERSLEERIAATRAVTLPFGMLVAGDLTPYLKTFFDKLKSLDSEVAEQKWQTTREAIIHNERPGIVPQNIDAEYPKTLDETIRMYNS